MKIKEKRNSSDGRDGERDEKGDWRIVMGSIKTAVFWDMTPCTAAYRHIAGELLPPTSGKSSLSFEYPEGRGSKLIRNV